MKSGNAKRIFTGLAMAGLTLFGLLFQNGRYYIYIILAMFGWALIGCIIQHHREQAARARCVKITTARVEKIEHSKYYDYLIIGYQIRDMSFERRVRYAEGQKPDIGELVKIYYDPQDPGTCVLGIYKKYRPGFSNTGDIELATRHMGVAALGLFLAVLAGFCLYLASGRLDGYTEIARGDVIGYEQELQRHTSSGGYTYEFRPVVEYKLAGQKIQARSVESWPVQVYELGQRVTVKYAPDRPDLVFIQGMSIAVISGFGLMAIGIILAIYGLYEAMAGRKARRDLMRNGKIDFLK